MPAITTPATDAYLSFLARSPDLRDPDMRETEARLNREHLVASGSTVRELEAIKASLGGVWHPGWEERLVAAKAAHDAYHAEVRAKAVQFMALAA